MFICELYVYMSEIYLKLDYLKSFYENSLYQYSQTALIRNFREFQKSCPD